MRARWSLLYASAALCLAACDVSAPLIESTTRLGPTGDTVGPYVVHTVIIGWDGEHVDLDYLVDDAERFIPVPMTAVDGEERFRGEIPGQPAGTTISYYVAVVRDGVRVASDPDAAGAGPYVFVVE
jgi:hypothetical protein